MGAGAGHPAGDVAHWDAIATLATPPAHDVDETIHHYHRAAGELWKFCFSRGGGSHAEFMTGLLKDMAAGAETIDWWERAAPRRRP